LAHLKRYIGALLADAGRLEEAEQFLREAIAIVEKYLDEYPESGERQQAAHSNRDLSRVLWAMRRPQEAEAVLRRSVELLATVVASVPSERVFRLALARSTYDLAVLLRGVGRPEEAASTFRDAVQMLEKLSRDYPESQAAYETLGTILATCPAEGFRDPHRAVKLAQEALRLAPESAASWELLGVAHYRAGNPTAAIAALQKATGLLDGGRAKQWLFLAMAHWQESHYPEAWQWYDRAAAWVDKYQPADEALNRFYAEAERLLSGK
jgi:tetratricopeptide (TPR) repeat protein